MTDVKLIKSYIFLLRFNFVNVFVTGEEKKVTCAINAGQCKLALCVGSKGTAEFGRNKTRLSKLDKQVKEYSK